MLSGEFYQALLKITAYRNTEKGELKNHQLGASFDVKQVLSSDSKQYCYESERQKSKYCSCFLFCKQ